MTTLTKSLSDVELKEDGDRGEVTAVFSTLEVVDLDGDVTRKGAFTDGAAVVLSAYGHTSWDGATPLGKGTIAERKNEAIFSGQFNLKAAHARDTWEIVKDLSEAGLQEWSYSLHNVQYEMGELDGRSVRYLNKIDVKEVSPVLRGAGINTRTLATKGEQKFSDHRDAVLTALDDLTKRALEVVTLRVAEGKPCPSADELLAELDDRVKRLRDGLTAATTPPPNDDDIRAWMRSIAISQGVTLS